jgi:hypothetical protein
MQYRKTHLALLFIVCFFACDPDIDEVDSNLYAYSLVDINSTSDAFGTNISPASYPDQVTLHYFGHQN